jgi:hypothetical protein
MNDLRQYILMRNDLQSMSPGRCMAQAAHAASAMAKKFGFHATVGDWNKQTLQGFGTTIVLAASKEQIDKFFADSKIKRWIVKDWVTDPDYVIRVTHEVARFMKGAKFVPGSEDEKTIAFTRSEKTCAYILGAKLDFPQLADWPLY